MTQVLRKRICKNKLNFKCRLDENCPMSVYSSSVLGKGRGFLTSVQQENEVKIKKIVFIDTYFYVVLVDGR